MSIDRSLAREDTDLEGVENENAAGVDVRIEIERNDAEADVEVARNEIECRRRSMDQLLDFENENPRKAGSRQEEQRVLHSSRSCF